MIALLGVALAQGLVPGELPTAEWDRLDAVRAALGEIPDGACVGVGYEARGDAVVRRAWWETRDRRGRPVARVERVVGERTVEETTSWIRGATRERRVHRRTADGAVVGVRVARIRMVRGMPAGSVERQDQDGVRVRTVIARDVRGREVRRVETTRDGPRLDRVVTVTGADGEGSIEARVRHGWRGRWEALPACRVEIVAVEGEETRTTRCGDDVVRTEVRRLVDGRLVERTVAEDGGTALEVWAWDGDRAAAVHREAPGSGWTDVRWVRDATGALVGRVELGPDLRAVEAFDAGCGEEPRPGE